MSTLLLLLVVSQSLSLGLGAIPDECADALRSLTGHLLFERAAITHVTTLDVRAARELTEPELAVRVSPVAVAYTVQGPRNEVAIVVCAPDVERAPAPAPAARLAPDPTAGDVPGS